MSTRVKWAVQPRSVASNQARNSGVGIVLSIAAFQSVDPGSIPGRRSALPSLCLLSYTDKKEHRFIDRRSLASTARAGGSQNKSGDEEVRCLCHRMVSQQTQRQQGTAMSGNRTRVNCLECSHDHHYTNTAGAIALNAL